MKPIGSIEIRITDSSDNLDLNPDAHESSYDEEYLKSLKAKAKKSWDSIEDPDKWLQEMRYGYNI